METLHKDDVRLGIRLATQLTDGISTELMQRCVANDTRTFTMEDLDGLGPDHGAALFEMTLDAALQARATGKTQYVDLDATRKPQAGLSVPIGSEDDIQPADSLRDFIPLIGGDGLKEAKRDMARALGSVAVTHEDGHAVVTDYFDFEPFERCPDDSDQCLTRNALDYLFDGENSAALRAIGRMFCKEGDNEQPTETSIPVRFTFPLPE